MADDDAARAAAQELTRFIDEIDAEIRTSRLYLDRKWGGADALPLYPTDADLPTTTVGTVRALLAGYKRVREENVQLREEADARRLSLSRILVQHGVALAVATIIGLPYVLVLGAPWLLYQTMASVIVGSAIGQGFNWWEEQRESDDG